jgi:iron complex transport system permease protein
MRPVRSRLPMDYRSYIGGKIIFLAGGFVLLVMVFFLSLCLGPVSIPLREVVRVLLGMSADQGRISIVLDVRLPRILTAVCAGMGLAASGTVMQSVLRNPLGSPFTLGISQAAAFGAALSILTLGGGVVRSAGGNGIAFTNPYLTTMFAFGACLAATGILIGITGLKHSSPEVMVLTGVAMASLFSAGIMFLQFFADDVQLGAIVYWTFGDVGRTDWNELAGIFIIVMLALAFFFSQRWNYNALDAGDETAQSLGVPVGLVRLSGMAAASLVTAVIIAFVGIIGFIGLVCPHMVRRVIGDDHRFLLPGSCLAGGIILLAADTLAQIVVTEHMFPVAIFTAFLGVPVFVYLIIRGRTR